METVLKATSRDGRGKGPARRLRAEGKVPGVLYGHGVEPVAISLSSQDLLHFFHATHGAAMVVDLEIDGESHLAIPREIQRDHLRGRYVHIDFLEVRRDEKVKMSVEIHETGEAPGVKAGGVIEHHLRELEIECLPGDVPEEIEADVTDLELGDMLRVGRHHRAERRHVPDRPDHAGHLGRDPGCAAHRGRPTAAREEAGRGRRGAEVPAEEGAEGAEAPAEPAPDAEELTALDGLAHRRPRQSRDEYARTRHNAGRLVVDELAERPGYPAAKGAVPAGRGRRGQGWVTRWSGSSRPRDT